MSDINKQNTSYTAADALNDALVKAGVSYVFFNSGTDYPPIIESWAKYEVNGYPKPEIIICPHEMVALSAAQGYAQATGQAQAVFVHVDVGTQNLGGSVHNAFRCRVPVFMLAGISPFTIEDELKGGRNHYIQFIQNVRDQASIVREYTKWSYEVRTGKNIQQLVYRAMQLAHSEPRGPVYLMAAREVLEEDGININADINNWTKFSSGGLSDQTLDILTEALINADNPLIITSYLGRNTDSVDELVRLSERLAIPVVEMNRSYMNFPSNNPLHLGFDSNKYLDSADLILVIDSDLPWIPSKEGPKKDCRVFYLDEDPLKEHIPLWYIPSEKFIKTDSYIALKQLNSKLNTVNTIGEELIAKRRLKTEDLHFELKRQLESKEVMGNSITPEFLSACLREVLDEDTIVLNEAISNDKIVDNHLVRTVPGTLFSSGGSALGWNGGAAIGIKLAHPDKNVVALSADGTYIFSCPTAVFWTARKYNTPFMTVIFNNQGWGAPKTITKNQHPDGYAVENEKFWVSLDPPSQLDMVANAAGGAFAKTVSEPKELKSALLEGLDALAKGNSAVINVILPPVSTEKI